MNVKSLDMGCQLAKDSSLAAKKKTHSALVKGEGKKEKMVSRWATSEAFIFGWHKDGPLTIG